jgi:hypothetical protein
MREGDMKTKTFQLASLLLGTLLLVGCAASKAATTSPAANSIIAAKTTAAITVDGQATEAAWATAPAATIKLTAEPGVEPRTITVRALYDDRNVYLAAKYADSTPLKVGETWVYDGQKWGKGPFDDSLAFVWNMNDSVKGFNENGMKVMTAPLVNGTDIYKFAIDPARSSYCAPTDLTQEADVWGWCGMPEFYGKGDDMHLAISSEYRSGSTGVKPVIYVQHDAHPNSAPWQKNEVIIDGSAKPAFMYKPGLDVKTTPRPYQADVVPITDYSIFKAGDKLPYVVGVKGAVWGGSKDDIAVKGARFGSDWSVEFARRLDTGHDDDIKLTAGRKTTLAIIIRDDSKGYALSAPVTLSFK